jgi:hypothetical protein
MNLKFIVLLSVLALASVGIVGLAHAQDDETEKANIPFDFYVGTQKMPAGSYRIGINLETDVISFTDESGKHRMFPVRIAAEEGDGRSLLVFEHSENAYALEELKSDAYDWAFQTRVPVPAMESRSTSSQVEVALNR